MSKKNPTQIELALLRKKIEHAKEYAKEHFNAENATSKKLFGELSFFVEFPTVDIMRSTPSIMGKPFVVWFYYRLAFRNDGSMVWNPIYGANIASIEVPALGVSNDEE